MSSDLFGPPPVVGSQWVEDHLHVKRKAGQEWDCLCPYHEDSSPSFRINVAKGVWYCHTCHFGGTLKKLAADFALPGNFILTETASDLRPMSDPPEPRPESYLARFFCDSGPGYEYWRSRGFTEGSIYEYDLGYDSFTDNVTYPLRNDEAELLGVVRRRLDDGKPKYKYPHGLDVSKMLFGYCDRPSDVDIVFITEGAFDAMLCWQEGVYAVAVYGSHPHEQQADLLHRLDADHYVMAFDDDKPGRNAMHILMDLEPFGGGKVSYVDWPDGFGDLGELADNGVTNAVERIIETRLRPVWDSSDLPS